MRDKGPKMRSEGRRSWIEKASQTPLKNVPFLLRVMRCTRRVFVQDSNIKKIYALRNYVFKKITLAALLKIIWQWIKQKRKGGGGKQVGSFCSNSGERWK